MPLKPTPDKDIVFKRVLRPLQAAGDESMWVGTNQCNQGLTIPLNSLLCPLLVHSLPLSLSHCDLNNQSHNSLEFAYNSLHVVLV